MGLGDALWRVPELRFCGGWSRRQCSPRSVFRKESIDKWNSRVEKLYIFTQSFDLFVRPLLESLLNPSDP